MDIGRRLAVRAVARGLRNGISDEHMQELVARRFSYRDAEWRAAVLHTARARNRARVLRRINA